MTVGMIGLGKLGLPVAVGFTIAGHTVLGFDKNPERMQKEWFKELEWGWGPNTFQQCLKEATALRFCSVAEIIMSAEIIFVAVDTNNEAGYDGTVAMPEDRRNYDMEPLLSVVKTLNETARLLPNMTPKPVAIMSTVLPGTIERDIVPVLDSNFRVVHNPQFCAMGTVLQDMFNPEFVILGGPEKNTDEVAAFYKTLTTTPILQMSYTESEIVKTCYNAFITMKINYANTIMEICHKLGANVDRVMPVLQQATDRLISPKYLNGGMGDGGGCHPKENMALSHLARSIHLSFDLFEANMQCREDQAMWLASELVTEAHRKGLDTVWLLGTAFKPEINLEDGSPALLMLDLINLYFPKMNVSIWDPVIGHGEKPKEAFVGIISCKHAAFAMVDDWPEGSVIIDPHRYIRKQSGITISRIGEGDN